MKKIIVALQGRGSSGKTTTITLLHEKLLKTWKQVDGEFVKWSRDFKDILQKGNVRLGISSMGDISGEIQKALSHFQNQGCQICICTCRTYDRSKNGTVAAVQSFPSYKVEFVPKTLASIPEKQNSANKEDVQKLASFL